MFSEAKRDSEHGFARPGLLESIQSVESHPLQPQSSDKTLDTMQVEVRLEVDAKPDIWTAHLPAYSPTNIGENLPLRATT